LRGEKGEEGERESRIRLHIKDESNYPGNETWAVRRCRLRRLVLILPLEVTPHSCHGRGELTYSAHETRKTREILPPRKGFYYSLESYRNRKGRCLFE